MSFVPILKALTVKKKIATIVLTSPILIILLTIKSALVGLSILIFIDLITGVKKSVYQAGVSFNLLKVSSWKKVKSYGLRETWKKTYEYGIGILVFATIEAYFIVGQTPIELLKSSISVTELVCITASIIELFSIWENLTETGEPSKFVKAIQAGTNKIISFLPQFLQDILKKEK